MRKHEFVANLPLSLLAKKNSKLEMPHFVSRSRCSERRLFLIISRPRLRSSQHMLSVRHVANCYRISQLSFATARRARQQNYRSINPVVIYRNSAHAELLPLAGFFDHGISSLIADIAFTGRLETAKTVVNCINDGQCIR